MKKKTEEIRVRLAPSPTGPLHLGTVRTALFNYLFARANQGKFILRIEDTDPERSEKRFEEDIIKHLAWLGLLWDEGPNPEKPSDYLGQYGPYRQSERTDLYQKHIKELLTQRVAFWCYHTKEELEAEKNEQMAAGLAPRHVCSHFDQPPTNPKEKGIIRFRCSAKKISFLDLIRGQLEFEAGLLGDISIARDDQTPLYNLGVVIDDAQMKISHVIRGEDHISNTPKQILLQRALGFKTPHYAHLPLILGPDRSKMSKRHGSVSMGQYKQDGYLAETIINFLALLGWNPGDEKEFFSIEELIRHFSLDRVQKGGAIFNLQRLDWLNGYYLRKMNPIELTQLAIPYLIKAGLIEKDGSGSSQKQFCQTGHPQAELPLENYQVKATGQLIDFNCLVKIISLEQERLKKVAEIAELTDFFFKDKLDYDPQLLIWKKTSLKQTKTNLEIVYQALSKIKLFDQPTIEGVLMPLTEKQGVGELLWPLRACLSGKQASPGPFDLAATLGQEKTLKRIKEAIERI